jgi:hypothetical protein
MKLNFVRTLRTASSERFVLHGESGKDTAALDLHYFPDKRVSATLVILDQRAIPEQQVPELLRVIDETLLPDVSIEEGKVSFTVVHGTIVGTFMPHPG